MARIACIQLVDSVQRHLKQYIVAGRDRGFEIGEIREQTKPKILLGVRKIADLQFLQFPLQHPGIRQQHGNDNQGCVFIRNSFAEIHARQSVWRKKRNYQNIDNFDRQFTKRKAGQETEKRGYRQMRMVGFPLQRHGDSGKTGGK